MNEYEMMYILHPRLTAEEATASIERMNQRIVAQGGEVLSLDNWGRRRLAYPIGSHFEGTYVLVTFRMPPEGVQVIERDLTIVEDVIRHLVIRGIIPFEGRHAEDRAARGVRQEGEPQAAPEAEPTADREGEAQPEATSTGDATEGEQPAATEEPGATAEPAEATEEAGAAEGDEEPARAASSAPPQAE